MENEEKCIFLWWIGIKNVFLRPNSEAYDRVEQEIQADFHGGTYGRDAAGTDGGCGEGCTGVECQGRG